ncbi:MULTISPECIES: hypothetical protein [Brucella/Ochrobactrum group]|uniref:hypothetical protein n=1 Tax=Brucella/Ochrobactrum group TaxID=2826938 RepID=UPI001C04E695|nr:hypothetical protein [Brucella sp. NBRC 12950]QWK77851.1 hypothetical protein KMS41_00970 [Ochrobactrum sp. BTU1]GLU27664.1 hypothetical protein Brsp01_28970 [Brucella sp. NBRC 12950]
MSKLGILCLSGAFILFGGGAFAQTVNVDNNTNSSSQAGATAIAVGGGSDSPSKIKTTVPAFAPGLVAAGVHSCAGSTSAGVGATGWGLGFGTTYEMRECNRRAYAAALLGMGQNAAALDLICLNKEVRASLNATGVYCPSQGAAARSASVQRQTRQASLLASVSNEEPAAIPASSTGTTASPPIASRKRTYSAKALGLSSDQLRAKGCVLRTTEGNSRAWHCPGPIM